MQSKQQTFEIVSRHLFAQGTRAMNLTDWGNSCAYRAPGGLSCAVGCLIPDEAYDESMEGMDIHWLLTHAKEGEIVPEALPDYFEEQKNLLAALQITHDMSENWISTTTMRDALRRVARSRKLRYGFLSMLSFADR